MPNPIDAPKKKAADDSEDTKDIVPSGGPAIAQAANAAAIIADAENKKAALANPPAVSVPTFGAGTTMNPNPASGSSKSALQGQSSLPIANTAPNAGEAGLIGASGEVPAVGSTLETTGHVKPGSPSALPPGPDQPKPVDMPITPVTAVAKDGPATKKIISEIISGHGTPTAETSSGGGGNADDFGTFLKGAVENIGEFLQRWGLNSMGRADVQTAGEKKQAQQYELDKQQAQGSLIAKQQALENSYQTARMNLQQQMNQANMTAQGKIDLQNRLTELQANYKNELALLPERVKQEQALYRLQQDKTAENDPARQILNQGK
jgi:hypothetical protein